MGRRYQAILKAIDEPFHCVDVKRPVSDLAWFEKADRFIVATPTETHYKIVKSLIPYGKPILCEKPFSKNLNEVKDMVESCAADGVPLDMMFQYALALHIATLATGGFANSNNSHYSYFRTGNDGREWDCMQVIALHKDRDKPLYVGNTSPIWFCQLNGYVLTYPWIEAAYVSFVDVWKHPHLDLRYPGYKREMIIPAHEAVLRYIADKGL